ncbi:hypothetical protein CC80DRAFT_597452 [Byssothecium circinans]|uniref:Uncharacterized protein n=1 Tax=Byssothecium circinans TaxID=147558 RepID=A0A6A5TEQ1_9PLEO|nr:hypothetical protein CC80DRAFT_597452 [Byssothecium circinans]
MGLPTTSPPQDAAPAYEDIIHIHPINRFGPSSSASGYASVPQEDIESEALAHNHGSASSHPTPAAEQSESLVQTNAGTFRPKPHVHCEACDEQSERRERRATEKHCCAMAAWVFIVLFACAMIFGIVAVNNAAKLKRHGHD